MWHQQGNKAGIGVAVHAVVRAEAILLRKP